MIDKAEMFVKGRKNTKLPVCYAAIFAAVVALSFIVTGLYGAPGLFLSILIFAGGAYGAFYLSRYNRIEYEYSVLSGSFYITAIRNQTKRKALLECDIKEIGSFGDCGIKEADEACRRSMTGDENRLNCTSGERENVYFFTVRANDGKAYRVFVEPDEKVIAAMKEHSFEIKRYYMKKNN